MRLYIVLSTAVLLAFPCYSQQSSAAEAMKTIAGLLSAKPAEGQPQTTDFAAIENVYRASFQTLAKACANGVDGDIDSALERGKRGQDVKLQKQWIEKSLQRIIHHTALGVLDRVPANSALADSAADLLKCLETVMDRRTKWLNPPTPYKDEVGQAVAKLKGASPKQAQVQVAAIRNTLTKVYLLSVLWELRGLAAAQLKDDDSPVGKRVEGMIYFNILAPAIKDTTLRRTMTAEWQKAPKEISVVSIRADLGRALPQFWKQLPDSIKNN
jgi:hypothetical protein